MVAGKHRSRTFRRVPVKVPGNTIKMHYRKRKPSKATCAIYGTELPGIVHATTAGLRNTSKSQRRPNRPFGGVLSSKAPREKMKTKARTIKL